MEYDKAMMDELDYQSALYTAKVEGREEGREEGIMAMAKAMKNNNVDIAIISQCSGLTTEQINAL